MTNDEQSTPSAGAAPRVPPSPAIQTEYWGEPEVIRPHIKAEAPLAVLDYWLRLRGPRRFPARGQFNPMEMRRYLPNIFLLDALPDGGFRYRVVGSVISEFFGVGNPSGMTPEEVFGGNAEVALSPLRICRDARAPYMHTASASWLYRDRTYVYYTVLLLPLGESDDAVDKILCSAEFLGEEDAARA